MGRTSRCPARPSIPASGRRAAARFSRAVALAIYGGDRPHGYVYGGSGGAFKTIACFENAPGVWDGAVPFVQGSPIAIPNCFAVQARAMQVLRDVFPQITDALEPGGSGDMYAGLDSAQREALAEVTRCGFPPGAWFDVKRIRSGYTTMWSIFAEQIRAIDPGYFEDFWTQPGYLGADARHEVEAARVNAEFTNTGTILAGEAEQHGVPVPLAMKFDPSAATRPIAVSREGLGDRPSSHARHHHRRRCRTPLLRRCGHRRHHRRGIGQRARRWPGCGGRRSGAGEQRRPSPSRRSPAIRCWTASTGSTSTSSPVARSTLSGRSPWGRSWPAARGATTSPGASAGR
jgi:hypothetical protein